MLLKFILQIFSIVIAAFTTELIHGKTQVDEAASSVCYYQRGDIHICIGLVAVAISSIMVCMMLMILDVLIPCVNKMVKIII